MDDMRMQFVDLLSGIGFVDKPRGANVSAWYFLFFFFEVEYSFPLLNFFLFTYFFRTRYNTISIQEISHWVWWGSFATLSFSILTIGIIVSYICPKNEDLFTLYDMCVGLQPI